jgi:hypothetical protein
MGLTNFNWPSIDRISLASRDAWIFSDSLDFGFNRIGLYSWWISGRLDVQLSEDWINVFDQSLFQGIGFGWFFRTLAFLRIQDFRFSLGIVAMTKQRCNTFLIGTKPFRPLADYRR